MLMLCERSRSWFGLFADCFFALSESTSGRKVTPKWIQMGWLLVASIAANQW